MRIYLKLTESNQVIHFSYQQYLTGALHKWIGKDNNAHHAVSLYSFSWLQSVDVFKEGIKTNNNSFFFISAYEEELIKSIVNGIISDPEVCFGARVSDIQIEHDPTFTTSHKFFAASPILVKRTIDNREKHFTYADEESSKWLTETLQTKLKAAGLDETGVQVAFDKSFHSPKTKVIAYKSIQNRVNHCPVIITGSPGQIAFAWNVGVGNSTGIGFGALK